jgi:MYXO-CTERM domain-containing protein
MGVRNIDAPSTPRAQIFRGAGLLFFLTLAGCADARAMEDAEKLGQSAQQRIEGGYGDRADRAVVGLVVTDGDGGVKHTCSGALIAPNLVLTARHCIAHTPRFVRCDQAVFGPAAPPERIHVTFNDSMWGGDTDWTSVVQVLPIPGDPSVCGRDVALLRIRTPLHGVAAPLTPRLDEEATPGETYSAIGFGASGQDANDAGRRRRRDLLEIVCVGQSCGAAAHVEGPEWRGDHGICNGDSGGPAIDTAGRVIGVTSRGPVGCDDPIYGGLTDFKAWLQEEAIHAAHAGNYRAAPWTGADPAAPLVRNENADTAGASCALRTTGSPNDARVAALLALAALALRRRRA